MRIRIELLSLLCCLFATALFAQPSPTKELLRLDKKQGVFLEGKTVVREVLFSGLDANPSGSADGQVNDPIFESDVKSTLKYNGINVQAAETLDLKKVGTLIGGVKEYLFERGYFNANVTALGKKLARGEMAIILAVERGPRSGVSAIRFLGMKVFSEDELVSIMRSCLDEKWGVYDLRHINYCGQRNVRSYLFDRGYFQARVGNAVRKFGKETVEINIQVNEGIRYRFGDISIKGTKIFTEREILEMLGVARGDIANGSSVKDFAFERLAEIYKDKGYQEFTAEFEPAFLPPVADGLDGTVNIEFIIDEGPQFKLGSIKFIGVSNEVARDLESDFPLKREDVFRQKTVDSYIKKLNDSGKFKPIDAYRDVEVLTPVEEPTKQDADEKLTLRPPRRERKNDIDLRIKITTQQ